MVDVVGIIGADTVAALWATSSPGAPVPETLTSMRALPIGQAGAWVPPVNSLIFLTNTIYAATGREIRVLPGAVNGSRLMPSTSGFIDYWNDPSSLGLPAQFDIMATGVDVSLLWFVGGLHEAINGATTSDYLNALSSMHFEMATRLGKTREALPLFVTPYGSETNDPGTYPYARDILAAQYHSATFPSMYVGPEYFSLSATGVLNETERGLFAVTAGNMLGIMLNNLFVSAPTVPEAMFTSVKVINHNYEASATSTSYRSSVTGLAVGGVNARVRFCAHNSYPLKIKSASIGVKSSGPNTVITPQQLSFSGQKSATIAAGDKLFSDIATLVFTDTDELIVTLDLDATDGNFRLYIETDAPMGGVYSYAGAATYDLATPAAHAVYGSNIDAVGFDLVETMT